MSALVLRSARRHVHNFADESEILREHSQSLDHSDCEAFLQLGIDAFQWLVRADETIRSGVYAGTTTHDPMADKALENLFRAWLVPCQLASTWIEERVQQGDRLRNLEQFRNCQRQVEAIVRSLDSDELTDGMRKLRDAAVTEHLHDETAEFV